MRIFSRLSFTPRFFALASVVALGIAGCTSNNTKSALQTPVTPATPATPRPTTASTTTTVPKETRIRAISEKVFAETLGTEIVDVATIEGQLTLLVEDTRPLNSRWSIWRAVSSNPMISMQVALSKSGPTDLSWSRTDIEVGEFSPSELLSFGKSVVLLGFFPKPTQPTDATVYQYGYLRIAELPAPPSPGLPRVPGQPDKTTPALLTPGLPILFDLDDPEVRAHTALSGEAGILLTVEGTSKLFTSADGVTWTLTGTLMRQGRAFRSMDKTSDGWMIATAPWDEVRKKNTMVTTLFTPVETMTIGGIPDTDIDTFDVFATDGGTIAVVSDIPRGQIDTYRLEEERWKFVGTKDVSAYSSSTADTVSWNGKSFTAIVPRNYEQGPILLNASPSAVGWKEIRDFSGIDYRDAALALDPVFGGTVVTQANGNYLAYTENGGPLHELAGPFGSARSTITNNAYLTTVHSSFITAMIKFPATNNSQSRIDSVVVDTKDLSKPQQTFRAQALNGTINRGVIQMFGFDGANLILAEPEPLTSVWLRSTQDITPKDFDGWSGSYRSNGQKIFVAMLERRGVERALIEILPKPEKPKKTGLPDLRYSGSIDFRYCPFSSGEDPNSITLIEAQGGRHLFYVHRLTEKGWVNMTPAGVAVSEESDSIWNDDSPLECSLRTTTTAALEPVLNFDAATPRGITSRRFKINGTSLSSEPGLDANDEPDFIDDKRWISIEVSGKIEHPTEVDIAITVNGVALPKPLRIDMELKDASSLMRVAEITNASLIVTTLTDGVLYLSTVPLPPEYARAVTAAQTR